MEPGSLPLGAVELEALRKARGWGRFVFVSYAVLCVPVALLIVAALVLPAPTPGFARWAMGAGGALALVYLVIYLALLMGYNQGIRRHQQGDPAALTKAFAALKALWILMVVSYVLSILGSIGMTIAQALGVMPAGT